MNNSTIKFEKILHTVPAQIIAFGYNKTDAIVQKQKQSIAQLMDTPKHGCLQLKGSSIATAKQKSKPLDRGH